MTLQTSGAISLLDIDAEFSAPWDSLGVSSFSPYELDATGSLIGPDGKLIIWGSNVYGQRGNGTVTPSSVIASADIKQWSQVSGSWKRCVMGQSHVLGLKTDNSLWAWGLGDSGQLGNSASSTSSIPVAVTSPGTFSSIAANGNISAGITSDGKLWAWGYLPWLALSKNVPFQIGTLTTWSKVAVGPDYMMAIKSDGTLWSIGINAKGQLGIGTTVTTTTMTQVNGGGVWTMVACGDSYSMGIQHGGSLWGWGWNLSGNIGDNTTTDRLIPTQIGSGTIWQTVSCNTTEAYITGGVIGLSTFGIDSYGVGYAWGHNYGSPFYFVGLGLPNFTIDNTVLLPVAIPSPRAGLTWLDVKSANNGHGIGLGSDKKLYTWGFGGNWYFYYDETITYMSLNSIPLGNFYAGGAYVSAGTVGYPGGFSTPIPSSSSISIDNFYGASKRIPELYTFSANASWTVPTGMTSAQVLVVGGGGRGGNAEKTRSSTEVTTGGGGGAGQVIYQTATFIPGNTVGISVGLGGVLAGASGQTTTVSIPGFGIVTAVGGAAGTKGLNAVPGNGGASGNGFAGAIGLGVDTGGGGGGATGPGARAGSGGPGYTVVMGGNSFTKGLGGDGGLLGDPVIYNGTGNGGTGGIVEGVSTDNGIPGGSGFVAIYG